MQQWEYKLEIIDLDMVALKEYLNKAGSGGWELCFFQYNAQGKGECIFKRPLSTADKIFNEVKNEAEGNVFDGVKPGETPFF